MAITLYDATAALFTQTLGAVDGFLRFSLKHFQETGVDPAEMSRHVCSPTCCRSATRSRPPSAIQSARSRARRAESSSRPRRPRRLCRPAEGCCGRACEDEVLHAGGDQRAGRQGRVFNLGERSCLLQARISCSPSRCRTSISTRRRPTTSFARKACRWASGTTSARPR